MVVAQQFGNKIRELREKNNLLQRQVASMLDIDTPFYSKIERNERIAKKKLVIDIAEILKTDKEELLTLWLADKLVSVVQNEDCALKAITVARNKVKFDVTQKIK
jgi:transcriptional regulator with XRE-family HTH domain